MDHNLVKTWRSLPLVLLLAHLLYKGGFLDLDILLLWGQNNLEDCYLRVTHIMGRKFVQSSITIWWMAPWFLMGTGIPVAYTITKFQWKDIEFSMSYMPYGKIA